MNEKLSGDIKESLGCKQGTVKAADHYKIYVGPTLDTIDEANLGVWIGPVNSGVSACADDILCTTDSQSKLQALLDIANYCGKMYRTTYGASKTKITISGPECDRLL